VKSSASNTGSCHQSGVGRSSNMRLLRFSGAMWLTAWVPPSSPTPHPSCSIDNQSSRLMPNERAWHNSALADRSADQPLDELTFRMTGITHVNESRTRRSPSCGRGRCERQRQAVERRATRASIEQLGVAVEQQLFKRQVLQRDCPVIGVVQGGDVLISRS
jgi:hypothetical protein